ncbi:hypothetical protein GLYMA_02G143850v4 [Glycine max]|nr:hypothetical protein GLYMA_02G143850v4 [Glycine max]KAH1060316.1 hypothetical protein GYH30_004007 [Glycine max]
MVAVVLMVWVWDFSSILICDAALRRGTRWVQDSGARWSSTVKQLSRPGNWKES